MSRWVGFIICAAFGLVMLCCALQLPAHFRAVDVIVLQRAGEGTPSLTDVGLSLVKSNQLGAAQLFLEAARSAWLADSHKLSEAVDELVDRQPALRISGSIANGNLGALLGRGHGASGANTNQAALRAEPFTEFIVRSENRTRALELLQASPNPLVQALLHFRSLTNTVLFPPSSSTSGQALDTAISISGTLAEAGHLSIGFSNAMLALATDAGFAGNPQSLEQVLMDLLSLGQRFNWGQLATFVGQINDAETLRALSELVRRGESVPVLYSAVCLSRNAAGVARYLTAFSETGLNDLRLCLNYRAGGTGELLHRNQRMCDSRFCGQIASLTSFGTVSALALDFARREPSLALAARWLLYLLGGFFVAAAFHFARRVTALEKPLQVRGFHLAREFLFASGFLLVVLLLSEPFLSQGSQKESPPFRLQLPTVGSVVPAGDTVAHTTIMNQLSLLALLLFFVLQALIYLACLTKLAEIRRQNVPARLRLKLLENEDHLFDAGLYLGFVGTIISLIMVSLGVIKPSLMAAYSSTSFGIIFVSFFKIFHLRPLRRKLLLEAELDSPIRVSPPIESAATLPS